jgi:elongation factor Ts
MCWHVRKKIAADKAREEGKPEKLIENIVRGRIQKFFKESCLLEQEFVMNDAKKSVAQVFGWLRAKV